MKKKMAYLYIFTSFFQAQFLTLDIGPIRISIARGLMLLLSIVTILDVFKKEKIEIPRQYSYRFILFWLCYTFFSLWIGLFFSVTGWLKLVYLVWIYAFSIIVFTKYMHEINNIEKMFLTVQFGIFIQMMIGIYEHNTGNYIWTNYKELFITHPFFLEKKYPVAMQNNPNDFALLMYIGTFISLACSRIYKKSIMKLFSYFNFLIGIYLIFISDSRSTFLGLIIGLSYMVLSENKIKKQFKNVFVLLLFVAVFIITIINWDNLIIFYNSKVRLSLSGGSEQIRANLILKGVEYSLKSFGLGIGAHGVFPWHNFMVEILAQSGIFIFIGFVLLYVRLFKNMNRAATLVEENISIMARAIGSILIGFIIAGLGPASALNIEWLGVIFAIFITFEGHYLKN